MSVRRALASRSVHLRIVPRPANLSEGREIFRVLQRFGELSTYKYLGYEYQNPADNVALAIYRDEQSAQKALDASPIRFALEKVVVDNDASQSLPEEDDDETDVLNTPQTPRNNSIDEILRPSQLINQSFSSAHTTQPATPSTSRQTPLPFEPPTTPASHLYNTRNATKWFQVTVDRSRAVHQDYIERQPYWKQFQPMKSMAQEDLAKQVPHIGLSDVSKRLPNAHRTPNRVLRVMSDYVENHMPTLRGIAEDREQERAYGERKGR